MTIGDFKAIVAILFVVWSILSLEATTEITNLQSEKDSIIYFKNVRSLIDLLGYIFLLMPRGFINIWKLIVLVFTFKFR